MRALVLGDRLGNISTGKVREFREIDYRALKIITERADMGSLTKAYSKKKLAKAYKRGMAYPQDEPEEWKWRMTEARMMLGEFLDWTGWEFRNEWSKGLWQNYKGSWQGQQSDVWVYGEQGLGDEVLFSQVLPQVQSQCQGQITLECEPRLAPIFNRSFPGIDARPVRIQTSEASGNDLRYMKLNHGVPWIPLGDLLRNFRRYPVQFPRCPWLVPDPEYVEKHRAFKGRTAITWRGAQGEFSWKDMKKLYPDAVSLQYDQAEDEDVEKPPFHLRDDVEDILGLLANVDRFVGPSNTGIHLSASIGTKTDVVIAPLNGRRKNILPWRYYGIPGSRRSIWYGDNLTRYENFEDYRRNRDKSVDSPFGL